MTIESIETIEPDTEELRLELRLRMLEAQEQAQNNFLAFCKYVWPEMLIGEHHRKIASALDRVISGDCKRLMIAMPPRHGKEIAHSTPVLTPKGWTKHGMLKPGDQVFHPSGNPVYVLAESKGHVDDYLVTTSSGETIRCHANHEWTVYDRSRGSWRVVEAKYLATQKLHSGPENKRGGRYRFQLPEIMPLNFEEKVLPLDPYFLGTWLGDGTASGADFVYHPSDPEPRIEIERRGFVVSSEHSHATTSVIKAMFGGQGIRKVLKELGVYRNKHIPDIYLRSSIEQRLDLLAGLIDTDGHVERTTSRVRIATCSEFLKCSLVELLTSLGQRPYVHEQLPCLSTSGIQGKQIVYYVGFQPTLDIPTKIPRKRVKRVSLSRRATAITQVEFLPNGEMGKCIQVDAEDGLYLVGTTLIPTHNSQMGSYLFPAYLMGKRPTSKLIVGSHTAELAQRFGRMIRNLVSEDNYRDLFPEMALSADSKAAGRWDTSAGGEAFFIGKGGAMTGRGGDVVILDDILDEQDAVSNTAMENTWSWYTSGPRQRLQPGGAIIVINTRWKTDDLSGRLLRQQGQLKTDQWEVLEFPAILPSGNPLWPEYWKLEELEKVKMSIGLRKWQAQWQQQPTAEEGAILKREWWRAWPDQHPPPVDYIIQSYDTAYSKKETADFSVITTWGVFHPTADDGPNVILMGVKKGRWDFPELKRVAMDEYRYWQPDNVLIEAKATGTTLQQELRRVGIPVTMYAPGGRRAGQDKVSRANAVAPILESGMVWAPDTDWAEDLIEECAAFPNGDHDDQVDSTIQALMRFRSGNFITLSTDEQWGDTNEKEVVPEYY